MGQQYKKKTATFSMTVEEKAELFSRAQVHGFSKPSHYVIALLEADSALQLEAVLDDSKRRVLRPKPTVPRSEAVSTLEKKIAAHPARRQEQPAKQ